MVKPLERPVVLALTYVVSSFLFGPAIFLGGYVLFTGGVADFCDAAHGGPASRNAKFTAVESFQVTGAVTMLAGGLVLLANLWARRDKISLLRLTLSSSGILAMMCGFGLVIFLSGPGGQGCEPPV